MRVNVNLGRNKDREEEIRLTSREDSLIELYLSGSRWEEDQQTFAGPQVGVSYAYLTRDQAKMLAVHLTALAEVTPEATGEFRWGPLSPE